MLNVVRLASALVALGGLVAIALTLPLSAPAEAKIVCKDGAQLIKGQYLPTPYCQDALVAQVARQAGFKVTDQEIRWNHSKKMDVCRVIGRDNRISQACIDAFPDGRSGPRG